MKHKELAEQAGIGYLYEYEMKWAWLGELEHFAELVRADERESITQGYKDMVSALRAIVAVAKTEDSFSMRVINDCANIAIKQARGNE